MTAALEPNIRDIFRRLGLTDNALRTIATSRPQRDVYYFCKELGQRTFSLPLGPRGLAGMARNTRRRSLLSWMRSWHGKGPEGFAAAWYRYHGDDEAAQCWKGARMARRNLSYDDGMMIWRTQDAYWVQKTMRRRWAAIRAVTYFTQGVLAIWAISALVGGFWREAGWMVLAIAALWAVGWVLGTGLPRLARWGWIQLRGLCGSRAM